MDRFDARRDKLRKLIAKAGADALLITNFVNVTYLTGFTGDDSYLLITPQEQILLTDSRYTAQAEQECPGVELAIRSLKMTMIDLSARVAKSIKCHRLAIEAESISLGVCNRLADALPNVPLKPTTGFVERLRMIKDKHEVAAIRRAIQQAEQAFAALRGAIRPDHTEKDVADLLEFEMRRCGAKQGSFEPIVAVGPRAALPHARPTNRRMSDAPLVLIDWGADEGLYKSDLTRVWATAKISPKLQRVYGVVLNAQLQAIAAIRPGVTCEQIDAVARSAIAEAGFGRRFDHGLGHAIGLDIHEAPRLGQNQKTVLHPGMVLTVEPGIYLPGWGGVRIEDDVLVTRSGCEVLTTAPKELEQIF